MHLCRQCGIRCCMNIFAKHGLQADACGKLKEVNYTGIAAASGCVLLLISPETSVAAAEGGMKLWWDTVVPSLLPFFIFTDMLMTAGVHVKAGRLLERPVSFLMGVPGSAAFVFVSGILSGYPSGARMIGEMRRRGVISRDEGRDMLNFCSTSGPLFIVGTVGTGMLGNSGAGYLILAAHSAGAVLTGLLLNRHSLLNRSRIFAFNCEKRSTDEKTAGGAGDIAGAASAAVLRSLKTIGLIGGFITIFSIITEYIMMFYNRATLPAAVAAGLLEMTVGCSRICDSGAFGAEVKIVVCAFMISFGGMSVAAQTAGVLQGSGIRMSEYMRAKLIHGLVSAALTAAALICRMYI